MLRTSTLTGIAIAGLMLAVALFIVSHGEDRPATTAGAAETTVQVEGTVPVRNRANEATVTTQPEQPKSGDPVPSLPPNVR
jgi:hypothetical protein